MNLSIQIEAAKRFNHHHIEERAAIHQTELLDEVKLRKFQFYKKCEHFGGANSAMILRWIELHSRSMS